MAAGWLSDDDLAGFQGENDLTLKTPYVLKRLRNGAQPWDPIETTLRCNVIAPGAVQDPQLASMYQEMVAQTKADRLIELSATSQAQKEDKIVVGTAEYTVIEVATDDTYLFGKVAQCQRITK